MSILVTGAAGFIGSHVVDRLLERGEQVVGLDNYDDFYEPAVKAANLGAARNHECFREVRGDIRDDELLASLPDDVDAIVHLAARVGVRPSIAQPALYVDVNEVGTARLVELARTRAVRTFVFASSSSVYGNNEKVPFSEDDPVEHPISPYAATKRAGELFCHTFHHLTGATVVCLRFFTVYGPRQRPDLAIHKFVRLMDAGRPIPVYGDGSSERDYTYVDDVLQGVEGALGWAREQDSAFEIVNLGESRTVALTEMIQVLADEMGVDPTIERLPPQPGDVSRTYADVTKAVRLFGYRPKTDFREGVRHFLRWFSTVGAAGAPR